MEKPTTLIIALLLAISAWAGTDGKVKNQEELRAAIADSSIGTITITADFNINGNLEIGRAVIIEGSDNKLTFVNGFLAIGDDFPGKINDAVVLKNLKIDVANSPFGILVFGGHLVAEKITLDVSFSDENGPGLMAGIFVAPFVKKPEMPQAKINNSKITVSNEENWLVFGVLSFHDIIEANNNEFIFSEPAEHKSVFGIFAEIGPVKKGNENYNSIFDLLSEQNNTPVLPDFTKT